MHIGDMNTVNGHPQHPSAWKGDETSYQKWFNDTLTLISDLIWPVFDYSTKTWRGGSVSSMLPLTLADLDLLRVIYQSYPLPINLPLQSHLGILARKTNNDLFKEEDLYVSN